MWYENLFIQLELLGDEEQAKKMSAYMQDKFPFLGVPKPARAAFSKPYLKESKQSAFDWDFVFQCWEKPYREAQYIGIEYVLLHQKEFTEKDLTNLERLITEKSWWETVDSLDEAVGTIVAKDPSQKKRMLKWSLADNMWLRRVAIDFQQKYKEQTDADLLAKIIEKNLGSKEFFINKAIGWSLREYSKVDAKWVRDFIEDHRDGLAPLSIKEGSKYI